jgi:hypothetical protein
MYSHNDHEQLHNNQDLPRILDIKYGLCTLWIHKTTDESTHSEGGMVTGGGADISPLPCPGTVQLGKAWVGTVTLHNNLPHKVCPDSAGSKQGRSGMFDILP